MSLQITFFSNFSLILCFPCLGGSLAVTIPKQLSAAVEVLCVDYDVLWGSEKVRNFYSSKFFRSYCIDPPVTPTSMWRLQKIKKLYMFGLCTALLLTGDEGSWML